MATKKHQCEDCGKATDLRGWVFESIKSKPFSLTNFRKRYRWWCSEHFRIHMFNLWPFVCTKACQKERGRVLGIKLQPDDVYVWFDLSVVLVPAAKVESGKSVPMKPLKPKCPWCGRGMNLVKELFRAG